MEILLEFPVTYRSDYMEVREGEIDGVRYRLIQRYAGRGKARRQLKPKVEVFRDGRWERAGEEG